LRKRTGLASSHTAEELVLAPVVGLGVGVELGLGLGLGVFGESMSTEVEGSRGSYNEKDT